MGANSNDDRGPLHRLVFIFLRFLSRLEVYAAVSWLSEKLNGLMFVVTFPITWTDYKVKEEKDVRENKVDLSGIQNNRSGKGGDKNGWS